MSSFGKFAQAMVIPEDLKDVIKSTDALDLEKLKAEKRPYILHQAEAFTHLLKINLGKLLGKYNKGISQELVHALDHEIFINAPRRLNPLPEKNNRLGQRVIEFSNKNLLKLTTWAEENNIILLKNMVHILPHPGGYIDEMFGNDFKNPVSLQNGITHGGIIIKPDDQNQKVAFIDWPYSYVKDEGIKKKYWAYITCFDPNSIKYVQGKKPSEAEEKGYYDNTKVWSVLALLNLRFSTLNDYRNDPLQIKKLSDVHNIAEKILNGNPEELKKIQLYCQEGIWSLMNLGRLVPLNQNSTKKKIISEEAFEKFEKFVTAFENAGGVDKPSVAWKKLNEEGLITDEEMDVLDKTNLKHVRIKLADKNLKPWNDYDVIGIEHEEGKDGQDLFGKPVTMAGLIRNFVYTNFPKKQMAQKFSNAIYNVMDSDNAPARQELAKLFHSYGLNIEYRGRDIGYIFASMIQAGFIEDKTFQHILWKFLAIEDVLKIEHSEISDILEKFIAALKNKELAIDNVELNRVLNILDNEARNLRFPGDNNLKRLMLYVAPQTIADWAKMLPNSTAVGLKHLAIMVHEYYFKS